jgi:hypothetical protein
MGAAASGPTEVEGVVGRHARAPLVGGKLSILLA